MNENNQTTLDSYNAHVQDYIDGTPQDVTGPIKAWINAMLAGLAHDAKILEIGTAFGRDAEYIEGQGYTVDKTDGSAAFVEWLNAHGHQARVLNALTDDLGADWNLIFADAVLLHFTREETRTVAAKAYSSLVSGGTFAFSLKQGEGEEWSEAKLGAPRYFCYWNEHDITALLKEVGFTNVSVGNFDSTTRPDTKWLHITATK